MLKAIEEILDGFHPERLLIEATGVADPYDILRFLSTSPLMPRLFTAQGGDGPGCRPLGRAGILRTIIFGSSGKCRGIR